MANVEIFIVFLTTTRIHGGSDVMCRILLVKSLQEGQNAFLSGKNHFGLTEIVPLGRSGLNQTEESSASNIGFASAILAVPRSYRQQLQKFQLSASTQYLHSQGLCQNTRTPDDARGTDSCAGWTLHFLVAGRESRLRVFLKFRSFQKDGFWQNVLIQNVAF